MFQTINSALLSSPILRLPLLDLLVLLLELPGVVPHSPMVDLHVAHSHQGGQHGLYNLLPVLQDSNAMNTNLQCGHAASRWLGPHYVLTGGGEGDGHLGHGLQDRVVTEQFPGLVPGTIKYDQSRYGGGCDGCQRDRVRPRVEDHGGGVREDGGKGGVFARKLPPSVDSAAARSKTKLQHFTGADVALDLPRVLEDDQLGGGGDEGGGEVGAPADSEGT